LWPRLSYDAHESLSRDSDSRVRFPLRSPLFLAILEPALERSEGFLRVSKVVQVLWPVLFCNPVIKIHGSLTTGIQNNRDHLTCYATSLRHFQEYRILQAQLRLLE
jgi:hypothetical protein